MDDQNDYLLEPDAAELAVIRREVKLTTRLRKRIAVLDGMERQLDRLEQAQLRRAFERISAEIEREREWLARENDHEERLAVIQRYYQQAHERGRPEIRRSPPEEIEADYRRR